MAKREYIEREALCYQLAKQATIDGQPRAIKRAAKIVEDFPAADVRHVITCGECEFWNRQRISCEGLARCNTGESGIRYRNRNDFCSRGKKREES